MNLKGMIYYMFQSKGIICKKKKEKKGTNSIIKE